MKTSKWTARNTWAGVLALAALWCGSARARTPSETFLTLFVSATEISGQWDVALCDLERGLKLEPERWQGFSTEERARWIEASAIDTVAHSVTLSLAVLGIVRVPARIVEPLIAISVIAAAMNNLRPCFGGRGWLMAFAFGLLHGFGLASGLIEFGSARVALVAGMRMAERLFEFKRLPF